MHRGLDGIIKADRVKREPRALIKRPAKSVGRWWISIWILAIVFGCVGTVAMTEIWPHHGAQVANDMRNLVGPEPVAQAEALVFQLQDVMKHWQYKYGIQQAEAPWYNSEISPELTPLAQIPIAHAYHTPGPESSYPKPFIATETPSAMEQSQETRDQLIIEPANPTLSATSIPYVWQLSALPPFGSMEDEGVWLPYLFDHDSRVVAARTFLQPDTKRPYAIMAVVAFDLTRTELHFVLGFVDPSLPDGLKGDGLIPKEDRESGMLLAAFNGGFRAANGHFGAMADGIVALPPKPKMATVGIYRNGEVQIGSWEEEIDDSLDLKAWRQNCCLIIQDGEISSKVYNDSIDDWGGTISNQIVTRRSGIGLDRERKTLYYFAGPSLSMPALADAMLAAGVDYGMLLDINNFWVHFTAIHVEEGKTMAEPLLPNEMTDQVDRYLLPSPVDFFYITLRESPQP